MTNILIRLFVINHEKTSDKVVRKSYGTLSSVVGIIINLILALIKIFAGVLGGIVELYVFVGVVISILVFLKILK